jgi:hypothetical protein
MKKDFDDIAKGLKIASTIGGLALKTAKTIHETIQSTQNTGTGSTKPQQPAQREALFCDQCGARCRPGKRFCNNCGARQT